MAPFCDGTPRRLWVGNCVVLYRVDGVPVAKRICRNVSSDVVVGSTSPLETVMSRFKSPPACLWQTSLTSGCTQFEHGLLSSCSTMVPASGTMNCEHRITPKL